MRPHGLQHFRSFPLCVCTPNDARIKPNKGQFPTTHSPARVAKAASYVVSETLTLGQFFGRGAAIGIQMKQSPVQGKPKHLPRHWDDLGYLLLDLVSLAS